MVTETVSKVLARLDLDTNADDPLALVEARAAFFDRVLEVALRATSPSHWCDMGGKPYLTAAGAEAVATRFGLELFDTQMERVERNDDKGAFYIYVTKGKVRLGRGERATVIECIGTCSSRDQFLGTETQAGRQLSEIDEGNIMKASLSNFEVNAYTRVLGIRGKTWEDLAKFGITKDGVTSVGYADGSKGGGSKSNAGFDIEIPFGKSKGKRIGELLAADLAYYMEGWERDLKDDAKKKYWKRCNESLAAAKARIAQLEEQEKAKAQLGNWNKLLELAKGQGVDVERLKALAKEVKADIAKPSDVTDELFPAIAAKVSAEPKKEAPKADEKKPDAPPPAAPKTESEQKAGW